MLDYVIASNEGKSSGVPLSGSDVLDGGGGRASKYKYEFYLIRHRWCGLWKSRLKSKARSPVYENIWGQYFEDKRRKWCIIRRHRPTG
jgi:hypothetical protein